MYTFVLLWSLKSQFNHALDMRFVDNLTKGECQHLVEVSTERLHKYNADVVVDATCELKIGIPGR